MTSNPAPTRRPLTDAQRKRRQRNIQATFLRAACLPTAEAIVTWLQAHPIYAAALAAAMKEET